jgi:hypothetical protein
MVYRVEIYSLWNGEIMKKSQTLRQFTVRLPIAVELGKKKKKKYYLNLNIMRNQVGHLINNVKKEYARIAHGVLPNDMFFEHFELEYELFLPNKLKRDISNVLSIIDKNFADALVAHNLVHDDNYEYLQKVVYKYGGYDPDKKGYVNITVKEVKEYEPI